MSLVLKSNKLATQSLGNINGIVGSQDWSLFLDFENGEYTKKNDGVKTKLTENQILFCTSDKNLLTRPLTEDRFGNKSVVTMQNQLRWWSASDRFGLLIEDSQENWFLNSSNPKTQTISNIFAGSLMTVSCIGPGSLIISGENITTITVTEKTPFAIPTIQSVRSINVEVVGDLTHAQVIRTAGIATMHTPIHTVSAKLFSGSDSVEIDQSLISSLIDKNKPVTIVFQTLPLANINDPRSTYNESRIVFETPEINAVFGLSKYTDLSLANRFVSSFKTNNTYQSSGSGSKQEISEIGLTNTQVIQITADLVTSSMNGGPLFRPANSTDINKFTRIKLGGGVVTPVHQSANCIFTKLVIFNRQLSDDEILDISKSWL